MDSGYESEGKGKRKQHCTYCKNHGKQSRKTNHKCDHENCDCLLCKLTRLSRLIMRHQQRLWRHLKDTKRREDAAEGGGGGGGSGGGNGKGRQEPPAGKQIDSNAAAVKGAGSSKMQKCDMCRNHGEIMSKRAHKNTCPYQDCKCELCNLSRKRKYIMRLQQRVRRSQVTSKMQNEVWEYVTQATAELESLSFLNNPSAEDQNASCSSSDSPSPSPDSTASVGSRPLKREAVFSCEITPPAQIVTCHSLKIKPKASPPVTPKMPPLELLPECSPSTYSHQRSPTPPPTAISPVVVSRPTEQSDLPHSGPPSSSFDDSPVMECEPTWKNLKREREDVLKLNYKVNSMEENLFSHLDFMRGYHHTLTRRLEPPVATEGRGFYNTVSARDFGSTHMSPFKNLMPLTDASRLPPNPLKKTRTDENVHFQCTPSFWNNVPAKPRIGIIPEDFQQQCYHSLLMNNAELRMQPPPGFIQIPQPQHPLRPRPFAPFRPLAFPSSTEWEPHPLQNYLAYVMQNRGTHYVDMRSFGLSRDAPPFIHHPVP